MPVARTLLSFGAVAAASTLACASAQLVLKEPLYDKCAAAGLRGCPEMVDGVIAYVDGDKADAEREIKTAAAKNAPERVRRFAVTLRPLLDLPAVSAYAGPIREVVDLLASSAETRDAKKRETTPPETVIFVPVPTDAPAPPEGQPASAQAPQASTPERPGSELHRVPPPVPPSMDATRMETRTIIPADEQRGVVCDAPFSSTKGGACVRVSVFTGPFVLTDLYAPGGCADELFVYAGTRAGSVWTVLNPAAQPLNLHGVQLLLTHDETLYVGVRTDKGSLRADPLRCAITLSGWRPELVGYLE